MYDKNIKYCVFNTTPQRVVHNQIIKSLIGCLRLCSLICVSRAKRWFIGTCAFHTTCVCADRRRRRRQRPNVLKFSVSSLTWANPCRRAVSLLLLCAREMRSISDGGACALIHSRCHKKRHNRWRRSRSLAARSHRPESNRVGTTPWIVSRDPLHKGECWG